MNKQPKIYYYDQESYENHQAKIAALMQKEKQLLEELNNLDKHYIDNIIIPAALARAEQKLAAARNELAKMKAMQIVVVNTSNEKSNTIDIGHIYRAHVSYFDGREIEYTFKLSSAHPRFGVPGKVDKLTIDSGIGKAILGRQIGEVCSFIIEGKENKVVVVEEIIPETTKTPEEMQ